MGFDLSEILDKVINSADKLAGESYKKGYLLYILIGIIVFVIFLFVWNRQALGGG